MRNVKLHLGFANGIRYAHGGVGFELEKNGRIIIGFLDDIGKKIERIFTGDTRVGVNINHVRLF